MAGDADLARTLCLRQPGSTYRFALRFFPELELRMTRTRGTPTQGDAGDAAFAGVAIVDDAGKFVFCAPGEPRRLLWGLSEWAKSAADRLPAAAALIGSGAAPWEGGTLLDPARLAIRRDDALWSGVANPGPEQTARVLSGCAPGDRLWYWLTDEPGASGLPVLLQPARDDPNRDFLNALIDVVALGDPGPAETGIAYATVDGEIQFLGAGLRRAHLDALAAWVGDGAGRHPELGRIAGARLLRTTAGRVQAAIEDATVWDGVARPAPTGG
jgi:hypothetical protein